MEMSKGVMEKKKFWRWRGKITESPQCSQIKYLNIEVTITNSEGKTRGRKGNRELNAKFIKEFGSCTRYFPFAPHSPLPFSTLQCMETWTSPLAFQLPNEILERGRSVTLEKLFPFLHCYKMPVDQTPLLIETLNSCWQHPQKAFSIPPHPLPHLPSP